LPNNRGENKRWDITGCLKLKFFFEEDIGELIILVTHIVPLVQNMTTVLSEPHLSPLRHGETSEAEGARYGE
jgi:hypothetical protein